MANWSPDRVKTERYHKNGKNFKKWSEKIQKVRKKKHKALIKEKCDAIALQKKKENDINYAKEYISFKKENRDKYSEELKKQEEKIKPDEFIGDRLAKFLGL